MATEPDGTLLNWRDIASSYKWDTLLLGNGMSINVWEPFRYRKLLDHAKTGDLSPAELKLFDATPNFERVLADLLTGVRVNEALGESADTLLTSYRSIQLALGNAVRAVHLNRERVPLETRRTIRKAMLDFEWVFTTSYDLLVYWSMGCERAFAPFTDHFRYGGRCEFDPARAGVGIGSIPVYFLHGALHLIVGGSGTTWKLKRNFDTLLDQFGQPITDDPQARPLLVTEGSASDKLAAIEANAYLSHALETLAERDLPVVVFGSGLSHHDAHLAEALSANPKRPVAVSMPPGPKRDLHAQQVDIQGRLEANPLLFFDSTTHPLGDPALEVPVA